MTCEQFRLLIDSLARADSSPDIDLIGALNHAESCPPCNSLLRQAETITVGLRQLAAAFNACSAPPRVETALLHALRARHAPAPPSAWRETANWLAVSAGALATAAALVFLLLGNPGRNSRETPPPAQPVPRETNRPASQRPLWADYAIDGEIEDDAAASYIPLASDFDPSWLEGGAIVRVVLTRPALESFGLPTTALTGDQMLADMVVSDDGTPEAIRLIDWQVADAQ